MTNVKHNNLSTLFVTLQKPYPPIGGVPLRNWQNINLMMQFGPVYVISIYYDNSQDEMNFASPPGVSIYKDFHVKVVNQKRSLWRKIQDKLWWLNPLGHRKLNWVYGEIVNKQLAQLIAEVQPQIVIFEELWLYAYLRTIKNSRAYLIYDAHNVEAQLTKEINSSVAQSKSPTWKSKFQSSLLSNRIKAIEDAFVRQVNQVWVCSEDDANLMRQLYGQKLLIQVVPNGINVSDYETVRLGKCPLPVQLQPIPRTIIFTAAFAYQPNSVAAKILIEQIYPKLQELYPECRLLLVGRNPTKLMREAAKNNPGIVVTGKVPDIRPYLAAASVVVVPLLEGGGTRLKILEAFAAARPVVSTSKGAEGLKVKDGEHLLIRDSVKEIVEAIAKIWSDAILSETVADGAYQLVTKEYSWEAVGQEIQQAVLKLGL